MDPATVIATYKENIQPLRYGRNAAQLGTALRAQEDADAQQLLLQEKLMYEEAIKNYQGDDPLENWYEYILWVEQSYPKSGHESHIGRLLQQCLTIFEKEAKYHQDRRYIRLWINYISMQKNPLELYQVLHSNGIGTMVADMYRAWAFELEQIEDYKHADEVYLMGLSARAEPFEELNYAHENFQLAVARKTLGRVEEKSDVSLFEQRQAFSSLRAIRAGKKVGSVRTGHRVRDYYPGTVSQISTSTQNTKPNSKIQIYQDDIPGEMKGSSILDHVPIEDTVHKENTLKPGPWNSGSRRGPLIAPTVKAGFKVHEDQNDDNLDKVKLFPNHVPFADGSKVHDVLRVPVYVADPVDPNIIQKPYYPKELVYADNADRSMEEIKAQLYFERRRKAQQRLQNKHDMSMTCIRETNGESQSQLNSYENIYHLQGMEGQKFAERSREAEINRQRLQVEQQELQRQQYGVGSQILETQRQEAERRELERLEAERREAERIEAERLKAQQRMEAERLEAERLKAQQRMEAERIEAERLKVQQRMEAERLEAERLEAQRMETELNTQRKLQTSNYMHQHHASSEEHLLGQSLTANTKEAMSVVESLWQSPEMTTSRFRSPPVAPRIMDSRNKMSFDIHMDSSMTQHAMTSNKHHQGYNVQIYNDQENHHSYHMSHHGYHTQEQQAVYANHSLQNSYYQMQQHHDHQVQQQHHDHRVQQQHHDHQVQQSHLHQHHPQHHQQMIPPHQQMHSAHHSSLSHSQHLQSPHTQQMLHHQSHIHHQSPHILHTQQPQHVQHQHMQHMQHSVYGNMLPDEIGYQYPTSMEAPPMMQQNMESPKQLHFSPYSDTDVETSSKPYRMPSELPYIKSPGMNRKDLKYLESAEDKENTIVVDYNGPLEENMLPKLDENNLYNIDENLGVTPLSPANQTCYTEAFNTETFKQLASSTPMTNHFKQSYRIKDNPQFSSQDPVPQSVMEAPVNAEGNGKLSVIMESTREYGSNSSSSSNYTRTTGLTFTLTREDMAPIKEQPVDTISEEESNESVLFASQPYDQKLRAQIQAVHAQSPRTVQRNVDQITSEIKNNCDLRKTINLKLKEETATEKVDTMECEEHEPMEQVEEEYFQLPSRDINPFDKNLISGLLRKIKFPQPHHADGYIRIDTNLNKLVPSTMITLGTDAYDLEKCLGKGMYGTVFKAVNLQTGETVALKTQRPAWVWEYYIVREIKARLTNPHMLRGFMDVTMAYVANNGSVLVSEYSKYGTLLGVTNQIKVATGKPLVESIAIFFTIEMIQIVEYLHKCQIIHGDIKPDNFLLMRPPTEDVRPTIQLIDFGCSIDMKLLPENTTFTQVIKTEDFTCIEMQTGRPWTYQTDLYCLAATSHCLLFGNYMRVANVGGRWFITSKLPRYAKKDAWEQFFTQLLNIESCEKMPDLAKLRNIMEETLAKIPEVQAKFRSFVNVLNKR